MITFTIPANDRGHLRRLTTAKGDAQPIQVDFSLWQEQTGISIAGYTSEIVSGQAALASESFASNVYTGTLTTTHPGTSFIKITAERSDPSLGAKVFSLRVWTRDPTAGERVSDIWGS